MIAARIVIAGALIDTGWADSANSAPKAAGPSPQELVLARQAGMAMSATSLNLLKGASANGTPLKSCDVCGVFWGAFAARDPKANAVHIATLFDLLKAGKIKPMVSATFPLARGGEAITMLATRKAIGKVVVTMG